MDKCCGKDMRVVWQDDWCTILECSKCGKTEETTTFLYPGV